MRRLKGLLIIYLSLNMLGSALLYPLIYLDFNLRKEYIQEVLCINKDKPITVCGGSCYLNSKLSDLTSHQEQEKQIQQEFNVNFFAQETVKIDLYNQKIELESSYLIQNTDFIQSLKISDIFHPPRLV